MNTPIEALAATIRRQQRYAIESTSLLRMGGEKGLADLRADWWEVTRRRIRSVLQLGAPIDLVFEQAAEIARSRISITALSALRWAKPQRKVKFMRCVLNYLYGYDLKYDEKDRVA